MVVGFDLDNTLYSRVLPLEFSVKSLGYNLNFNDFKKEFTKYSDIYFYEHLAGKITFEKSRILRIQKALKKFDIYICENEALNFQKIYEDAQKNINLFDGYIEVFEFLKEHNIKIFIYTNGEVNHQKSKIKALNLKKFVDEKNIFISDEIGFAKPDINGFLYIKQILNLKDEKVFFIGDNIENDLKPCILMNWIGIKYNFDNDFENDFNGLCVDNPKQIIKILRKYL